MKKLLIALIAPLFLGATATAATIVSVANLPVVGSAGTANLLQVTGARPGAVTGTGTGGPATADTRTFYYFAPDSTAVPGFTGSNWPIVFIDGDLGPDGPGVSASVTAGAMQATGLEGVMASLLLIDDRPLYFFTVPTFGDTSATTANGIYTVWYGVSNTGSAVVPERSTGLLLAGGPGVFEAIRRRSTR